MKNKFLILTIFVLLGMMSVTSDVYAQGPMDFTDEEVKMIQKRREIKERLKAKIKEKLGLTDEQQRHLEVHRKSHRKQLEQHFKTMKGLKSQLRAELEKINFDEVKVRSIHEEMKDLKSQMADQLLNGILEVRKVLTVEQFQKFIELKEHMKGKWKGMHKGSHREFGMYPREMMEGVQL